ncbi:hypothetical protein TNCT_111971 [Trichonephila clavata]|uniref:Uncharacterized protein n=1 Tax=Trichonephila clavata TaxID=2740835 RepID=A0A8X6J149_TRICU|nr:hypothetical protein TNCT_111971 [Trichonephila clavata]
MRETANRPRLGSRQDFVPAPVADLHCSGPVLRFQRNSGLPLGSPVSVRVPGSGSVSLRVYLAQPSSSSAFVRYRFACVLADTGARNSKHVLTFTRDESNAKLWRESMVLTDLAVSLFIDPSDDSRRQTGLAVQTFVQRNLSLR